MSCNNPNDYIINILKEIELKQDCKNYNNNPCEQKLGMSQCIYNTIPLMFMCQDNCDWYISSGVFKDPITNNFKCFETPIFRVIKVDKEKQVVVLELLQSQTLNGEIAPFYCKHEICKFFSSVAISKFIRTGIYINININSFSGLECLQPVWAKRGIPKGITNSSNSIIVETSEYITVSDSIKRVYLNSDGIKDFNVIPDPLTISYYNLFVNGMLQPPSFCTVVEGKMTLNTQDIPISGTYIILQFIKINK
ncbi:MAG: CotY/CotZ family spore coat protein [Bacilli bacterium]|nr:CotY/CotZ family spore coat protein [Bacilli bacterium]